MEQMVTQGQARLKLAIAAYLGALLAILSGLLFVHANDLINFATYIWTFAPVGVFGAIIANSTGTGGGVVFVPAFNALSGASEMGVIPMQIQINTASTIGISFLIQCFGMSVGSCVWLSRFYGGGIVDQQSKIDANEFLSICFVVLVTTLPALLVTQFLLFDSVDKKTLLFVFKLFSLGLGIFLLIFTWAQKRVKPSRFRMDRTDLYNLLLLGTIGGVITAFFSVGVGELVTVYLIWRKYPTLAAVALAVVISVVTVIAGVCFHIAAGNIVWPVALAAIPGAMIGGFIARILALWLGSLWLKTMAALWIALSSGFLLVGPYLGWLPT